MPDAVGEAGPQTSSNRLSVIQSRLSATAACTAQRGGAARVPAQAMTAA